MSYRAAIVLFKEDKVALIERYRAGMHYYSFPGGHIEEGETPEEAALRETEEELGLKVVIRKLLARMNWQGSWQYYYLVETIGGTFGTGTGEEMVSPRTEKGSYQPVWMAVSQLLNHPVLPREMAILVARYSKNGWPEEPVTLPGPK